MTEPDNIERIVGSCSNILLSDFGFKPEQSSFHNYQSLEWENFIKESGIDDRCTGVYFPRHLSAHLNAGSEFLPVNLMHEFFGHGSYCEHSIHGKQIVNLEKRLEDEEKCLNNNYSNDKKVLHAEYLKDKEELTRIANSQIGSYEGFAIWLESYLSERTDNNALFEKKMAKEISPSYSSVFNDFKSFEKRYGAFAIVAQLGFPKYYDQSKIVAVLKNFLEKEFDSIELCILYGSKKPYSDIDIFIVSDSVKSFSNHWLDIYSLSRSEFDEKIKNFSIDALDPVFSGEVLKGDNIEQIKQRVLSMPVTEDTISYNLKKSEEQGQIAGMYHEDSKERRIALSYQRSYYENAKNLKEGKKILTLKSIESQ